MSASLVSDALGAPVPHEERTVSQSGIGGAILLLRGQRVMLDADLARLYGVETKNLVKAVASVSSIATALASNATPG